MKLILPFVFIGFVSFGQITLTDQHFCGPSESYIFSQVTNPLIDYATTGANHSWDFSDLVSLNQRTFESKPMSQVNGFSAFTFGSFAPSAYKATYFNSTTDLPIAQISQYLPINITEMNQFSKKETSQITSVGYEFKINGQGIGFRSDTIEKRYVLPLEYNDQYQSRGYTSLNMNPFYDAQWKQYRQRQSVVDGWGTVQTPFGTFDALRIHHVINEMDSIYFVYNGTGMWLPLTIPTTHEYEWRSTSDKEAVLRIKTNVVLGNEVVTSIEYRDNLAGLKLIEQNFEVTIFPNPVMNELKISSAEFVTGTMIVDAVGRVWERQTANSKELKMDVSQLPAGRYSLVVFSETSYSTIPFVK